MFLHYLLIALEENCNYLCRLTKLREYTAPTQMNSASLHPDCSIFVCGGEDLKMYKFDYATGTEIGKSIL